MRTLDFTHTHEAKGELLVPGNSGDPLYPDGATFNSDGTVEITDEMVIPMPAEGEQVETGVIYDETASGNCTFHSTCRSVMPTPRAASIIAGSTPVMPVTALRSIGSMLYSVSAITVG